MICGCPTALVDMTRATILPEEVAAVTEVLPNVRQACGEPIHFDGLVETPWVPGVRIFPSGATRDTDENKLDYEGFLSPHVLRAYAEYMHKHRKQSDGQLRASDNWQKGIPPDQLMKSLARHYMETWLAHRDGRVDMDALYGIMFNTMALVLHELKKEAKS
jgi:hypothetical protein